MRRLFATALMLLSSIALFASPTRAATVTVFAAASLREALDEQARQFEARTGDKVVVSYAGSNALARQIESGAPADVFISADLEWMDYLDTRALLAPKSRIELLRNRLVLVAPADSNIVLPIGPGFPLAGALGSQRLALANPDSVPAGKYAKAALQALGVWDAVRGKLARTENVRAALVLVARGETPLGIVYATDAAAEPKVRVVGTFGEATHPPIVYAIAVVGGTRSPVTGALVTYLASPAARPTWERYGFTVVTKPSP
ncbi:MAG: molybdate ABC transporter substrate-binding protein [Betaproteobacteria bacterium]